MSKYVTKTENGDILLSPCEWVNKNSPMGLPVSPVVLLRYGCTFRWLLEILDNPKKCPSEYSDTIHKKTYRAITDADGNLFLEEIRSEGIAALSVFRQRKSKTFQRN